MRPAGCSEAPGMDTKARRRALRRALQNSAEIKGPGKLVRARQKDVDLGPTSASKQNEGEPIMPKAVLTNRHEPIPIDFGPVSVCFGHDPKLLNCEIAQPSKGPAGGWAA